MFKLLLPLFLIANVSSLHAGPATLALLDCFTYQNDLLTSSHPWGPLCFIGTGCCLLAAKKPLCDSLCNLCIDCAHNCEKRFNKPVAQKME